MPYKEHHIEKEYLTHREAAELLSVSVDTVKNWSKHFESIIGPFKTVPSQGVTGSTKRWTLRNIQKAKMVYDFYHEDKEKAIATYIKGRER